LSFTFQCYILNLSYFLSQLLLSSWKRSFIPGICGLIAGSLYRFNVLGIRRMKVIRVLFPFIFQWFNVDLLHLSSCNRLRLKIGHYFFFCHFIGLVFLSSSLACLEWYANILALW
jgi:hypothetical protein